MKENTDHMSEDIKVSIIMPVHNGKEHLRETLDCIVKQTFADFELICVDDESTDNSVQIIEEYQKQDKRITLYKNKKSNAGAARNFALDRASGKYLLFWDADDLYEPDAVNLMYQKMEEDQADIGVCNADHYDTESKEYIPKSQYLNKKQLPDSIPFSSENNGRYILNFSAQVAWNKMFLREFVVENEIRFQEIPRINDHYFVSISLIMARRITVIDHLLIHYRTNQKENLTGTSSDTPLCKYEVQCDIKNKLEELNMFEREDIRQSFINKAVSTLIHGLNIQNSVEGFHILYNKLKDEGLEKLELTGHAPEYFYSQSNYRNVQMIETLDYNEYLLQRYKDFRYNIESKKLIIAKYKQEVTVLKKEINDIKTSKWHRLGKKILPMYNKLLRK